MIALNMKVTGVSRHIHIQVDSDTVQTVQYYCTMFPRGSQRNPEQTMIERTLIAILCGLVYSDEFK
jgi:hypothetical protein